MARSLCSRKVYEVFHVCLIIQTSANIKFWNIAGRWRCPSSDTLANTTVILGSFTINVTKTLQLRSLPPSTCSYLIICCLTSMCPAKPASLVNITLHTRTRARHYSIITSVINLHILIIIPCIIRSA